MLSLLMPAELAARVRIRSWQDLVLYIIIAVLVCIGDFLLKRFFPNMSQSIRRLIVVLAVVVICIAFITITSAFS